MKKFIMLALSALLVFAVSGSQADSKAHPSPQEIAVSIGHNYNAPAVCSINVATYDSCLQNVTIEKSINRLTADQEATLKPPSDFAFDANKLLQQANKLSYCACSNPDSPAEVYPFNYSKHTVPIVKQYSRYSNWRQVNLT